MTSRLMDSSILARIEALESSNRRLRKLLGIVAASSCLLFAGWRQSDPDVIRAQRFVLVDDPGQNLGHWSVNGGVPGLYLHDVSGTERIALFSDQDSTALFLKDATGTTRVGTALFPHGGGFALHGTDAKGAAVMTLMKQRPGIAFYDDAGNVTREILSTADPESQKE